MWKRRFSRLEAEPQRELQLASAVVRGQGQVLNSIAAARTNRALVVEQVENVHIKPHVHLLGDREDFEQRGIGENVEWSVEDGLGERVCSRPTALLLAIGLGA